MGETTVSKCTEAKGDTERLSTKTIAASLRAQKTDEVQSDVRKAVKKDVYLA